MTLLTKPEAQNWSSKPAVWRGFPLVTSAIQNALAGNKDAVILLVKK
jgi:hypothetical protein